MHTFPYRPPRRTRPARDPIVATAEAVVRTVVHQQAERWRASCEARWFDVIAAYARYESLADGPERDAQRWTFAVRSRELREHLDSYVGALHLAYGPRPRRRWLNHRVPKQ